MLNHTTFFILAPMDMDHTSERKNVASPGFSFFATETLLFYGKNSNGSASMYKVFELKCLLMILGIVTTFFLILSKFRPMNMIQSVSVVMKALFYQNFHLGCLEKVCIKTVLI